jgi:hypothetical protein
MTQTTQHGNTFAWPVPTLTNGQLDLMSDDAAKQAIAYNYEQWEAARYAITDTAEPSLTLAQRLSRKARA